MGHWPQKTQREEQVFGNIFGKNMTLVTLLRPVLSVLPAPFVVNLSNVLRSKSSNFHDCKLLLAI